MRPMGAVVGFALALLLAGGAVGQGVEPEVVFEDVEAPRVVQPLGAPVEVPVEVHVACGPHDEGTTFFEAAFRDVTTGSPVNLSFSPATFSTVPFPGDCTAPGSMLTMSTTARTAMAAEGTRAFEPVEAGMEVLITITPPSGMSETHGPYEATLTAVPGYFELYNVRSEDKIQQGGAGEALRFEVTIDNFSNGATRFHLSVTEEPEGIAASVEPVNLTVKPAGAESFTVSTRGGGIVSGDTGAIKLLVDPVPVADQAKDRADNTTTVSLIAEHRARATPTPGVGVLAALLAGLSVLAGRSRAR